MYEQKDDPLGIDTSDPDWSLKAADRALSGVNKAAIDEEIARVEKRWGITELERTWWGRWRLRFWIWKWKRGLR